MALAAPGFRLASTPLLFVVLFGLGVQATFLGPLSPAGIGGASSAPWPADAAAREFVRGVEHVTSHPQVALA